MEKILIINTGGTFNKVYNPLTGNLDINPKDNALKSIAKHWLTQFMVINIIGKDSLDMTDEDRDEIYKTIKKYDYSKIIIVHGTDTMDQTAYYLDFKDLKKSIVLTGAMVPYSINPIEATANFASAYGYLCAVKKNGVYIAMNGVTGDYKKVIKNKEKGYFEGSKQFTFS
ncbi:asparaginase [bacterium]|nr:asparaginase [bacterium]MBU1958736.1 asparaginase [bacterium]